MTSDKCEHEDSDENSDGDMRYWSSLRPDGQGLKCYQCGARFVPETLLREARATIRGVMDCICDDPGDEPGKCLKCAARLHDIWSRLDAILGGEAGRP